MQVRKKKKNNKTRHKIRKKNHLFVFYFTHVQVYNVYIQCVLQRNVVLANIFSKRENIFV